MVVKLNIAALQLNKLIITTIVLSLILLSLLGYLVFFQRSTASFSEQSIIIAIKSPESQIIKDNTPIAEEKNRDNQPVIAIFLNDFGLNKTDSAASLALPSEIALGVSVYNPIEYQKLPLLHNILLNIPMAPLEYLDDPSLQPLTSKNSNQENLNRLDKFLDFFKNYQAIYSDEEEIYTNIENDAMLFLNKIKQKNLIYLSGITDKNAMIYKVAKKINFHILKNDIILDEILAQEAINSQLKKLEEIAQNQGYAIAKASQYQLTIAVLKEWLPSLANKNIRLVSVEEFYKITNQRRAR